MPSPDYHAASAHLAAIDADWARLVAQVGPCTLAAETTGEPYAALVRAVAYQQLHGRAAEAILGRLLALYPDSTFPTPEHLLATDFARLRACGLSARKIETIQGLAAGALSGLVPSRAAAAGMDDEALIQRLVSLRGIGRWTVEMLLIFSLGRLDVLPADDFGVRNGYRRLKRLDALPTPREVARAGLPWSPWRSVAAWYLWRVPAA
ncbi:DNA-3-methyladenine glycosylase [Pseudomonas sp. MAP12]|uniref:DNA-3-methyladenine glycosylase II n=1 Tax=Geopseudomonas aromaticivorans TaxID=2849492 RepID=A0ABS6MZ22_9GAMM|nr:DNA-3-methyladenine glycosylase [Pseudomonas aromaticivorans]MBV2134039.1 DNA-3-methyladenine glycosylase [Pseudomonas aromaticivorans]